MGRPRIDITNQRFGQQTVIECSTRKVGTRTIGYLKLRCDCGVVTERKRFKPRKMCAGCADILRAQSHEQAVARHAAKPDWEEIMKNLYPHMDIAKGTNTHPLCHTWRSMIRRCHDAKATKFPWYGAKGVTVCDRWRGERKNGQIYGSIDGMHNFLADMGEKPSENHTLDRIDPFGNYEPANCRWATSAEQGCNKRVNAAAKHNI